MTNIIHDIGVPAHIKGYQYLRDAIILSVNDMEMLNSITKVLYPTLQNNIRLLRAGWRGLSVMRFEVAWSRGKMDTIDALFGYTVSTGKGNRPTLNLLHLLQIKFALNTKITLFQQGGFGV